KRAFVMNFFWKFRWFSHIAQASCKSQKSFCILSKICLHNSITIPGFSELSFGDEKRICMFTKDRRICVLQKSNQERRALRVANLVPSVKLCNEGVIMAACFSYKVRV